MPDKHSDITELTIQLPASLLTKLSTRAKAEFRTPSGQVVCIIAAWAAQEDSQYASSEAQRRLLSMLRKAHVSAGTPPARILAGKTPDRIGKSSAAAVMAGRQLPTWFLLRNVLAALGISGPAMDEFRMLWATAKSRKER